MSGSFYVIAPTESQVYAAMRSWLITVLPAIPANNVVQGQANRVAPPIDPFATMLISGRRRLATNGWVYDGQTTRTVEDKTQITMQINLFGAATSNPMQAVTTLWRDQQAVSFFNALGVPIFPLFASEVRQIGFITGEKQYDDQWSVDLEMEVNFTLAVPQDFATHGSIETIEIDATYPPIVIM